MDIEFHYYALHVVAAAAGFRRDELRVLAYSSQYTDDNDRPAKIRQGRNRFYHNRLSQTLDILKPQADRLAIYPLFHFIPGEPDAPSARRADGATHPGNTTPDSPCANRLIDASLRSGDLYRVGIACHAYADTWAHQNFVGGRDRFNALPGPLNALIPNIGHADARRLPDWPAAVWRDPRLARPMVDNKPRVLAAASRLFEKLRRFADPACGAEALAADRGRLVADLDRAIGARDDTNAHAADRVRRYQELAVTSAYGGGAIPDYDARAWFDACVTTETRRTARGAKRRLAFTGLYARSDWFRFQEAVKRYAEEAEAALAGPLTLVRRQLR